VPFLFDIVFSLIDSGHPNKHWEREMEGKKNVQLEVFAETMKTQMGGLQKEVSEIKEKLKFNNQYIECFL
jgi:hypothetical protein